MESKDSDCRDITQGVTKYGGKDRYSDNVSQFNRSEKGNAEISDRCAHWPIFIFFEEFRHKSHQIYFLVIYFESNL